MAIMVHYGNSTFGFVENRALDDLIDSQTIIAFRRESGWVQIGLDPIRKKSVPLPFEGRERRGSAWKRSCLTCAEFVNAICQSYDCSSRKSLQGKEIAINMLL